MFAKSGEKNQTLFRQAIKKEAGRGLGSLSALYIGAPVRQAALSFRLAMSSFSPGPMVELRLIFWM